VAFQYFVSNPLAVGVKVWVRFAPAGWAWRRASFPHGGAAGVCLSDGEL